MAYPEPTPQQIEHYRERGWLTIDHAVPHGDVTDLLGRCQAVLDDPSLSFDPSRIAGQELDKPDDPVLMSMLLMVWPDWQQSPLHTWTARWAAALAGKPVTFWYDQLLFKPPQNGAPTYWHQDEAYLGAGDDDLLVSCWLTLQDVPVEGGAMQFADRAHKQGIIPALLTPDYADHGWQPDTQTVACPLAAGGVTFHHGKMPHMTLGNTTDIWRMAVIQRFTIDGVARPTGHAEWPE